VSRSRVLERLVAAVERLPRDRPARVAVDGPDAAGKTTLADELASLLRWRGHETIRASLDGFHRPRPARHARGDLSPEGYYEDAFDLAALRRELLDPLGPGGTRRFRPAVFDHLADEPLEGPVRTATERAILIVDGVFLLRPELRAAWDLAIFVSVGAEEVVRRARLRDAELFGTADAAEARYRARYLPAQMLYRARVDPEARADLVLHNDDPERPCLSGRLA
jgi:uridine kinase